MIVLSSQESKKRQMNKPQLESLSGKQGLKVLNETKVCAETIAHLLDDEVTPTDRHFVRNNGNLPERAKRMDAEGWILSIDGEVERELKLSLPELKNRFEVVTLQLQLECAGNGRAYYEPMTEGDQWTTGAVACSKWTGVRLADFLKAAGLKSTAVYTGHFGEDAGPSGDVISRGIPVWKAMEPHTLVAFEMNGDPIPAAHGFPVRLVVPGWAGSTSQKWLTRIWIRDQVHDGAKMNGSSYRVPFYAATPGTLVPDEEMKIIESMPVKSLITYPATEFRLPMGNRTLELRGHAWAGDDSVARVDLSYDFGSTWISADLSPPANPYAWQRWRTRIVFPTKGYFQVWARATDTQGRQQPFSSPGWNPQGYLNNAMHHIILHVGGD